MRPTYFVQSALVMMSVLTAWGTEPLVGTWHLDRQEIDGQAISSAPMVLTVSPSGEKLGFEFAVPVNNAFVVSMSYTVKLDGTEAEVKNARGEKVGSIRITAAGPSEYKLILKAPNRPDSTGKLTVSADSKVLTSEAESVQGVRTVHSKQTFSRH